MQQGVVPSFVRQLQDLQRRKLNLQLFHLPMMPVLVLASAGTVVRFPANSFAPRRVVSVVGVVVVIAAAAVATAVVATQISTPESTDSNQVWAILDWIERCAPTQTLQTLTS